MTTDETRARAMEVLAQHCGAGARATLTRAGPLYGGVTLNQAIAAMLAFAAEQSVAAVAMREAAAKVADEAWGDGPSGSYDNGATSDGWNMACNAVAAAIRARSSGDGQ